MHARTLNPYVTSAFEEWQGKHRVQPQVPREGTSWAAAAGDLAGCSSFGMSGTNAHGLFAVPESLNFQGTSSSNGAAKLAWKRARHWPQAPSNHMLASTKFERNSKTCKFQVPSAAPQLAFLLDHIIQNTPIMPGAGMLETAASACTALRDADGVSSSGRLLCLTGASIPAPVVLQPGSNAALLECRVECATGDVQLRSSRGSTFQVHFKATAGSLTPLAETSPSNPEETNGSGEHTLQYVKQALLPSKEERAKRYIRCSAFVARPPPGSATTGFLGHPAVMDNALQLGPATGDIGKEDDAEVTRVVAGISAFVVSNSQKKLERPGFIGVPTVTERAPMAANGTIYTSHWLLGEGNVHSVHVLDLQAKVINLEANASGSASASAAAAMAEDRARLIYAVEWQASDEAASVFATEKSSLGLGPALPTYMLTHSTAATPACFSLPPGSNDPAQATTETCSTNVEFIQTLMQLPGTASRGQLRLHSHGAHPAARSPHGATAEPPSSAAALSMQSFMRVASAEYPATQWSSVDLQQTQQTEPESSTKWRQKLVDNMGGTDVYCRIAGAGVWTAPRLLVRTPPSVRPKDLAASAELAHHLAGSVVITGGMGALGTLMATWLAPLGAPKLWLLGRSGRTSGDPLPRQLYVTAGQIVCARGDVSSSEEAADIITRSGASAANPLRSVMHAGAVLDSKVISNVTSHSIRTEYSGKVFGAQHLAKRTSAAALSVLQLFSSLASFSGAAGQATYAAANGVLDAWSHAHQGAGLPAVAVQWGNWGGGGMAVKNKGFIERMEKMGLGIIDPGVGLGVMARMLYEISVPAAITASWQGAVSVSNVFLWDNIVRALPAVPAFLEEFARPDVLEAKKKAAAMRSKPLVTVPVTAAAEIWNGKRKKGGAGGSRSRRGQRGGPRQASQPSGASPAAQTQAQQSSEAVLSVILNIMTNLGGAATADQPFMESGIDSLGAVQLRNEIGSAFGVELQPTVTFDHPTPAALAKHVASQTTGEISMPAAAVAAEDKSSSGSAAEGEGELPSTSQASALAPSVDILPDVLSVVESILSSAVGPEDPLMASGLDSLGAVQLRNAISERFGVELPATAALDFPTSAALASHIAQTAGVALAMPSVSGGNANLVYYSDSEGDFAPGISEIVGVSCVYPGQAAQHGAAGFWQAAIGCEDLPSVIPPGRWDIERHYNPDVTGILHSIVSLVECDCTIIFLGFLRHALVGLYAYV